MAKRAPLATHNLQSRAFNFCKLCNTVCRMTEVLRTNDLIKLTFALHLLAEAGIDCFVADGHIAAVEGSIGAFPRRLMVADDQVAAARLALREVEAE
jgi:Putative prokaryotic signal transducing protein